MKDKTVRLLANLLAVVMVAALLMGSAPAHAENSITVTKAPELAALVKMGKNNGNPGPISITQGKMISRTGRSQDIYLVTFSGTELVLNQSTEVITDLLSGFNLNNPYYFNAVRVIRENIKAGSKLVLAGTSLGGMVAQQVAANPLIKREYQVLNTVGFGSPLLSQGFREGTIQRLGDWADPVPYLSINTFTAPIHSLFGLNRESSRYKLPIQAHINSYISDDPWGKYDATGTLNGGTMLVLDLDSRVFYPAPFFDLSIFRQ